MKIPQDMEQGRSYLTNSCGSLTVIKYHNAKSVLVEFKETGYRKISKAANIRDGLVKDVLYPSFCGVGVLGDGIYSSKSHLMAFTCWAGMIRRCYSAKEHKRYPSYKDCEVCEEWQNFQVFAEWFYENLPKDLTRPQIDKDIKLSGNKLYSPETCSIVSCLENNREMTNRALAKTFTMKSPEGEVIKFHNMSKFCRDNGLSQAHLNSVFNGKRKSHKGWTV